MKVPTSETGMAAIGTIEARQVCRNRMTTTTTADRLENRLDHLVDRFRDELGRIVDDVVAEPRGKLFDRSRRS